MQLMHFGSQSGSQSALPSGVLESNKEKQLQGKEEEGPTTVKAMAKEIKLAQESKKVPILFYCYFDLINN